MTAAAVVHRTPIQLRPDPGRVITRFFVPGREDVGPTGSRAGSVIDRILQLSDDEVESSLADLDRRFRSRHRSVDAIFDGHAEMVATFTDPGISITPQRRRLIGASFTHEYAIEAAALCNPSMVPHPVQDDSGATRFILSVRGIGEGHKSSIGFRTGSVAADGTVVVDEPSPYAQIVSGTPGLHYRSVFHAKLDNLGDDFEHVSYFLSTMPSAFDDLALGAGIDLLAADVALRHLTPTTIDNLRELARWSYRAEFPAETELSERVLWPHSPPEFHGMEDARFVRFTEDDGTVTYYATYTAFDNVNISQQLLETTDFRSFISSPVAGAAAAGKGLALFPRRINGRFVALTRHDPEINGLATSEDVRHWPTTQTLQIPQEPWEILQLGNCGSPIETRDGWLVLTHGVGAMRTYAMGALLLDLDRPEKVLARTMDPILVPDGDDADGYVPNVVYSCGAMAHGGVLVVPYGVGDQSIRIATVRIDQLIGTMQSV